MIFHDRAEAGKLLLPKLSHYKNDPKAIVLGLPRGGVITAYEVAHGLQLPLDIVVSRKIGAPGNLEFAIGAITEEGRGVLYNDIIEAYDISPQYIGQTIESEKREARRRLELYRGQIPVLDLEGKTVLLVDDGIATAATIRAAIISVRAHNPSKVVVIAPVIASDSFEKLQKEVDEIVTLDVPNLFMAVSQFYEEFPQVLDEEIIDVMQKSQRNLLERILFVF